MRTRVWHTSSRVNPRSHGLTPVVNGRGSTDAGSRPTMVSRPTTPLARPGRRGPELGRVKPGSRDFGPAQRDLRNEIRLGSRDVSSARRNPPRFNPRRLAWHNASRADIIESTPPRGGNAQTEVK